MARTTNNSNRKFRKLAFQGLESRCMMAGDVAVAVTSGDLRITGGSESNEVRVIQTVQQGMPVAGSFFVQGLNGTTINGLPGATFRGVTHDFRIDLAGGDDRLSLSNNTTNGTFTVPNDLQIEMGNGLNTVGLNGITVRDDTSINTGSGRDEIYIRGTFGVSGVDNGLNDVTIKAGEGVDIVRMRNTFVRHDLKIDSGSDDGYGMVDLDTMNIGHNLNIVTGTGRDTVAIDNIKVNCRLSIETGADGDSVSIKRTQVDELFVDLGAGSNQIQVSDTFAHWATIYSGFDV